MASQSMEGATAILRLTACRIYSKVFKFPSHFRLNHAHLYDHVNTAYRTVAIYPSDPVKEVQNRLGPGGYKIHK